MGLRDPRHESRNLYLKHSFSTYTCLSNNSLISAWISTKFVSYFDGRKEFIRRVRKTRVMDIKQLQVNDSSYIEGTICLVNE